MFLPNGKRAIVDIRKLRDYCLNPDNPRGSRKARVFRSALGVKTVDASWLRKRLLQVAASAQAQIGELDRYGQRFTIDFQLRKGGAESNCTQRLDNLEPRHGAASYDLLRQEEEKIMAKRRIRLLTTVALNEDLPGRKLKRGEVGTVVEVLAQDVYEVEFCDEDGQTYAEVALKGDQLIPLHNQGESLKIVA